MRSVFYLTVFLLIGLLGHAQIPIIKSIVHTYDHESDLPPSFIFQIKKLETGYILLNSDKPMIFNGSDFIPIELIPGVKESNAFELHVLSNNHNLYTSNNYSILQNDFGELDTIITNNDLVNPRLVYLFQSKNDIYFGSKNKAIRYNTSEKITDTILNVQKDHIINHNFNSTVSQRFISMEFLDAFSKGNYYFHDLNSKKVDTLSFEKYGKDILTIGNEIFILSDDSLHIIEQTNIRTSIKLPAKILKTGRLFQLSGNRFLVSFDGKVFFFDKNNKKWISEIRGINGDVIVKNDYITGAVEDEYGNLYLLTNFQKLIRVQLSTDIFGRIGDNSSQLNAKEILVDEDENLVFVGTSGGQLKLYNTQNELLHNFKELENNFTLLFIEKIGQRKYIACDNSQCIEITWHGKFPNIQKIKSQKVHGFFSNKLSDSDSLLQYIIEDKLLQISKLPELKIEITQLPNYLAGLVKADHYYGWDQLNNSIARLSSDFKLLDEFKIGKAGLVKYIHVQNDSMLLIGSTNGLSEFNSSSGKITNYDNIIDCIYSIVPYKDIYYCSTNNGIIEVKNKKITKRYTVEDGLQSNEFNTNAFQIGKSGSLYFGGVNGVSYFHPEELGGKENNHKTFLSPIKTNKNRLLDIATGGKVRLDHGENNIDFSLSTIGTKRSGDYNNQYFIDNYSDNWIDSEKGNRINLTLSPGLYKIYYHSSPFFEADALRKEYFELKIPEYWYQTNLFYIIIMGIILLLGFFLIYLFNKNKFRIKTQQLKNQENLQLERNRISRELHDNIGIQMSIVGRNTDWIADNIDKLSKEELKNSIQELNNISEEMNQNLRDTIWASKKESYSTEDLFLRTQAFAHKIRLNYPNLVVELRNLINEKLVISPSRSLNLFRIIQEATHNTIKHSEATKLSIEFRNPIQNDHSWFIVIKDNGKGFLTSKVLRGDGLDNIEDRSEESNFSLEIESKINIGTRISCYINKI